MKVFSQNNFWVNCFFINFRFSRRKLWNPGKKLVRVVIRFFFVSRGPISGKNFFLEKITLIHLSGLERGKKFNSRRKSFTNVVSVPFYVFSGKLSGKQVVLEKHTNLHQFWILKQNSIETSQKKIENNVNTDFYVPSWTFKIVTPAKDFSEGCTKSTLRFQLIAFAMKTFFAIFLLLHIFRTSSGKKYQLSTYVFCKAVNVRSTYSDEHFLEKNLFWERLKVFIKFGLGNKNISRNLGTFPKTMSTLNN